MLLTELIELGLQLLELERAGAKVSRKIIALKLEPLSVLLKVLDLLTTSRQVVVPRIKLLAAQPQHGAELLRLSQHAHVADGRRRCVSMRSLALLTLAFERRRGAVVARRGRYLRHFGCSASSCGATNRLADVPCVATFAHEDRTCMRPPSSTSAV